MTAELLSSKIVVQEEPSSQRSIQGVATGVFAFVGVAEKGPVGVATRISSVEEFKRVFGGDIAAGISASIVRAFFGGGGRRLYFTRTVHYTDITSPASKTSAPATLNIRSAAAVPAPASLVGSNVGPFALTPGDNLIIAHDAAANGTAVFNATAGKATSTSNGPFTLANNQTLTLKVNGSATVQTITFHAVDFIAIAAAGLQEVLNEINAQISGAVAIPEASGFSILSNRKGSSSAVEITGGTAATALGLATAVASGTGNVADISTVTIAEIKTIVEAAVPGVTVSSAGTGQVRLNSTIVGSSGSLQVLSTSTAIDELGFATGASVGTTGAATDTLRIDGKYDGAYANGVTVIIGAATSGVPSEFNLTVRVNGVTAESYPNLTMLNSSTRHVEAVVNDTNNGSRFITVTDLNLSPGAAGVQVERPANSPGSPAVGYGPLTGGSDGLRDNTGASLLTELDFIGDPSSRTGFNSFDLIDEIELLACPEMATPAVHNAGLSYASVTRSGECFFIVDPPAGLSADGMNSYVTTIAAIKNSTEHGATYWPRVKVLNPNTSLYGSSQTITVPPSGHLAAMFARTDAAQIGGIYQPPGGVERGQLIGVVGLENDSILQEAVRDLIVPNLINPITRLRGYPIAADDVLTLMSGGNFPTIAERRGVSYIERSIKDGLQFARIRNQDSRFRDEVKRTAVAFLLAQWRSGAFRGDSPETSFFVDNSGAVNPPSEVFAYRHNIRIGLATQKPARFIIMSFSQDTRALDEELAVAV